MFAFVSRVHRDYLIAEVESMEKNRYGETYKVLEILSSFDHNGFVDYDGTVWSS